MVEEHAGLIESGYCSCNQSKERKTKVTFEDLQMMASYGLIFIFLNKINEG